MRLFQPTRFGLTNGRSSSNTAAVHLLLILGMVSACLAGGVPSGPSSFGRNALDGTNLGSTVPSVFIIEAVCPGENDIAGDGSLLGDPTGNLLPEIDQLVNGVVSNVLSLIPRAQTRHLFKSPLFCGLSLELPEGAAPTQLLEIDLVKGIFPVERYLLARNGRSHHRGLNSHLHRRDQQNSPHSHPTVSPPISAYLNDTFNPHVMGQVDQMHNQGLLGIADVKVCVIDSGIDYTLSQLGGCFGPGCKVESGYDFAGDNGNTTSLDPRSNCVGGHGTHVAGTISSYFESNFGSSGVGPGLTLGAYRAVDCKGHVVADALLAAYLRASRDGCKVINLSIGEPSGWSGVDHFSAGLVTRAGKRGIVTVAAASNQGTEGTFFAASPGSRSGVIGVASAEAEILPVAYDLSVVSSTGRQIDSIPYHWTEALGDILEEDYVLSAFTLEAPTCSAPKDAPTDFSSILVIVSLADPCISSLLKYIHGHQGKATLSYYSGDNTVMTSGFYYIDNRENYHIVDWFIGIKKEEASKLLKYAQQPGITANFRSKIRVSKERLVNTQYGGQVSWFSQWGPTFDMKSAGPTLLAPGADILSTLPAVYGKIGVLSGTSCASPFVAGVVGLILSHRASDNLNPAQVSALLTTTSEPKPALKLGPSSSLESVAHQGSGLIQAMNAFKAQTFIKPDRISLNDTKNFNKRHTIRLQNRNAFPVTYSFESVAAQSIAVFDGTTSAVVQNFTGMWGFDGPAAEVTFHPASLTIEAGDYRTFDVSFSLPKFEDDIAAKYPVYSGWVKIHAPRDPVASYVVPYFGVANDLSKVKILDTSVGQFYSAGSRYGINGLAYPFAAFAIDQNQSPPSNASQVMSDPNKIYQVTRSTGLNFFVRFNMGSLRLEADLVDADTTFIATYPSTNQSTPTSAESTETYDAVKVVGNFYGRTDIRRDGTSSQGISFSFQGNTSSKPNLPPILRPYDTPVAKNKIYRALIRVLKLNAADPTLESSWESWLSPKFELIG